MHNNEKHFSVAFVLTLSAWAAHAAPIQATADGHLGLYPATNFRIANSTCRDCTTTLQSL